MQPWGPLLYVGKPQCTVTTEWFPYIMKGVQLFHPFPPSLRFQGVFVSICHRLVLLCPMPALTSLNPLKDRPCTCA